MEKNKIFAAILCALLLFMITGFISEAVIAPEKLKENAYKVEVADSATSTASEAPKELPPISPLLAAASADEGAAVFKKCAACHSSEKGGPNKVGPNLWNIVNNKHAHIDGFAYSDAIKTMPGVWDYESLNKFIHKPAKYAPGTKMSFAGISSEKDRANLIVYLHTLSDSPAPLPK